MKRRYSVLKFIVFMFLFMIPVCFSDWVYLNKTASVAATNTDEVTVTIHTRTQSSNVTFEGPTVSAKTQDKSKPTRTFYEDKGKWQNTYSGDEWLGKAEKTGIVSQLSTDKKTETIVSSFKQEKLTNKKETTRA